MSSKRDSLADRTIAHWLTLTRTMLRGCSAIDRAVFVEILGAMFCGECGEELWLRTEIVGIGSAL